MTLPNFKFKSIIYLALFCLVFTNSNAQTQSVVYDNSTNKKDSGFTFLYSIPGSYTSMKVDALENVYAISGGSLIKFSPTDKSIQTYNNVKKYGNPSLIDVNNPFKTLVLFKNYATIVVLDKYLANKNTINLRKKGIFSVSAIGSSYDNKIWLFDEQDFKLKKIEEDGSILMESNDLRITTGEAPMPVRIFDIEGFVYLFDLNSGFYIFDYYGTFKGILPFTKWQEVLSSNGYFYGLENNKIFSYQIKTKTFKEYILPQSFNNSTAISTINGKIYLLKESGIDVFSSN